MPRPLPPEELAEAVRLAGDCSGLRSARLFITGGTGFFGRWLLETLGEAERRLSLGLRAVVLSRDPEAFLASAPHLRTCAWLGFQPGDIRSFAPPPGDFTHLIHGAASSDARHYARDPGAMRQDIAEGTRRVMEHFAGRSGLRALFISSGAVYGTQPSGITHLPDGHPLPPDTEDPGQAYAQGKREAERIAAASGLPCPIARCFAFAGPHLPLDQHFAFGNFIRDALAGGPIRVNGDGTPRRSYLYASELAAWLLALLLRGESTSYNLGSDRDLSILELAEAIGQATGAAVELLGKPEAGRPPSRYVPDIGRLRRGLGLDVKVDLPEAIARSLRWHGHHPAGGAP